ncbi:hypothetical protein CEXT_502701 [Caerostris extrusa]|uniref:U11/U12 small nuclear ribonucleoprotein 35 kDa protein n=1 Tax=Caerostris extrusa TaxID=172846 RepID=A0AAV4MSH4_CAEEX|nr:hypothetical protein CEXT_502701 [Caerostris extrusa]
MAKPQWEPIPRTYDPLKAGSIDGTDTIPHDHGIVRAMQAEYKPNKLVVGDPKATVFVGMLNPCTDENKLRKLFSGCGKIKRLRLVRDIVTGFSKGYAFVEYYDKYDAIAAKKDFDRIQIDDKEILVESECERTLPGWVPRRLGGGFSGKKESGQLRFGCTIRPFRKPIIPFKKPNLNGTKKDSDKTFNSGKYYSRKYFDRHSSYKRSKYRD